MPRKRDVPIPEKVLNEVIAGLEMGGNQRVQALQDLFEWGPLFASQPTGQSVYGANGWIDDHADTVGSELLGFIRAVTRNTDVPATVPGALHVDGDLAFGASRREDGTINISVSGRHLRDILVQQLVTLLRLVGLKHVRSCAAPDCERIYVKTDKREYCSPQCQKRVWARTRRANERHKQEQRARRRRQQRG